MQPFALLVLLLTALPVSGQEARRDSAIHLLNRAAWGPRPGDVDRVLASGIETWIDAQLAPGGLQDTSADRFVARYRTLDESPDDLLRLFTETRRADQARRASGDTMGVRMQRQGPPTGIRLANLELQQATIARAILSERQLYEVLVDVWTNHFNVFLGKGPNRALTTDYVLTAIRPHALGRFEDLLIATAHHPAMLVYLDNAQSVAAGATPPGRGRRATRGAAPPMPTGINENYARELLELHTLGVDGGYSQDDIIAVARIFTGWSLDPRRRAHFQFHAWAHDRGSKTVMGRTFTNDGEAEGNALLRWLANHPSTMRNVSATLCARFVADEPPDGCIDAGVHAWEQSGGEIRAVVRAILRSPEFWAPEARNVKIKTPLEFIVSAARALGAVPDTTFALANLVQRLGQPLFLYSPPTGYPERMESWVSSSALFDRFNVALGLASRRAPGLRVDVSGLDDFGAVERAILPGGAGSVTRETILRETADLRPDEARLLRIGLALGSPEFQRQ